jgi:hypothetical protein
LSRKRKPKKRALWPFVVAGIGALMILASVIIMVLKPHGRSSQEITGGTPAIQVDRQTIDCGGVKLGTNLTFDINVTNTGTGTLRFAEAPYIEVVEGC